MTVIPVPSPTTAPFYWKHEASGVLFHAMHSYLAGLELDATQILVIRTYLRQWIQNGAWTGSEVEKLRAEVDFLTNYMQLDDWIERAQEIGADPL